MNPKLHAKKLDSEPCDRNIYSWELATKKRKKKKKKHLSALRLQKVRVANLLFLGRTLQQNRQGNRSALPELTPQPTIFPICSSAPGELNPELITK